ncbi:MAG: hypothetical protein QE271_14765 [Bacteriovoracaceae bacterium]|nr:hypothetical protein [Bacteriovoracaceae bacterium]
MKRKKGEEFIFPFLENDSFFVPKLIEKPILSLIPALNSQIRPSKRFKNYFCLSKLFLSKTVDSME